MQAVLITTNNRGIYFGYLAKDNGAESVVLEQARVVVSWDTEHKGFLYLATHGPEEVAEVSPACERMTVYGIATMADCSPAATEAWDAS